MICVVGLNPVEEHLACLATSRLSNAFADSTKRAYNTMFKTFLAFAVFMSWDISQVTAIQLLCFLECLQFNGVRHSQMLNYLSAIKTKLIIFGLDVAGFADPRLKYYQKAVQMHTPMRASLKKVIDISLLKSIVNQCDYTFMGQIYKALYLLSFYSFLRLSNLVPHAMNQFSPLKHLARGDVIFRPGKAVILVKWSKTMQNNDQVKLITVPRIPKSNLCPVSALLNVLSLVPEGANLPLFQIKVAREWVPLTDSRVRRHFDNVLGRLQLRNTGYTPHAFRRSGATFAFNNNVDLQNIQRHGTWTSDCVWRYITDSADAGEQVANMFRDRLSFL